MSKKWRVETGIGELLGQVRKNIPGKLFRMQNYKDLKVWQKAHALTLIVYKITRCFPKEETFGITSQMRRASVSIPANIAEGCGRMTRPDIANFFQIALGSLHELEY